MRPENNPRKKQKFGYDFTDMRGDREQIEFISRREVRFLADNECPHGSLPHDPVVKCQCWAGVFSESVLESSRIG